MSDPVPTDGRSGVFGTLTQVARRMAPEALGLVMVNIVFVAGLVWLFERQNSARERVLTPVLAACSQTVPIEALRMLSKPESISSGEIERIAAIDEANKAQHSAIEELRKDVKGGVSQETIISLRQQLTDVREEMRAMKVQMEALRGELIKQTTVRLKGPER